MTLMKIRIAAVLLASRMSSCWFLPSSNAVSDNVPAPDGTVGWVGGPLKRTRFDASGAMPLLLLAESLQLSASPKAGMTINVRAAWSAS